MQQYKYNFNKDLCLVLCSRCFVHLKSTPCFFLLEEEMNILLSVAVITILPAGYLLSSPVLYVLFYSCFFLNPLLFQIVWIWTPGESWSPIKDSCSLLCSYLIQVCLSPIFRISSSWFRYLCLLCFASSLYKRTLKAKTVMCTCVLSPKAAAAMDFCCHINFLPVAACGGTSNMMLYLHWACAQLPYPCRDARQRSFPDGGGMASK